MSDKAIDRAAVLIVLVIVAACCYAPIFQARQEAAAFNRCNPGASVTTWEALWAEYRITDCKIAERR